MAKAKTHFVYSTLAADTAYTTYQTGAADMPVADGQILIKGGTGVADKRLITPTGAVITKVDEEALSRLRENQVFQLHEANGFIVVSDHAEDGEVVAADMTGRDESAPLVPADFPADNQPIVGADAVQPDPNAPPPINGGPTSGRSGSGRRA